MQVAVGFMDRLFGRGSTALAVAAPTSQTQTGLKEVSNRQNRQMIAARFDQQFTTSENQAQWGLADAMSVDASANYMVRRTLRMRCRYEYHNNPFFMGAAQRLAKFVIGTGPRLHMLTDDEQLNSEIET